jgi:peptidoglycan-associated lipoprotein
MTRMPLRSVLSILALTGLIAACGGNTPPVPNAPAPNPFPNAGTSGTDAPAPRPPDPPPIPEEPGIRPTDLLPLNERPLEELNGPNSPLKPVFFHYDSEVISEQGQQVLNANAELLRTYSTWVVTIEGHCDERGTAEYNLALGDRRALAARNYLVSLGIAPERLRTVSYGKEFPFEPGHTESAWSANRRAHFMLTAK